MRNIHKRLYIMHYLDTTQVKFQKQITLCEWVCGRRKYTPENEWTLCPGPEGTRGDPKTKMQISTESQKGFQIKR